jgi:NitT/TauT family transport system substrate-binding protein
MRSVYWLVALAMVCVSGCVGANPQPAAPAAAATPQPLTISIGWGVTPMSASPASVVWLANDLGFYAEEGLKPDLQLLQGTPNVITGMRAGQLDIGLLTAYEAVLLNATDSYDLKMIGGAGAAGQTNTFMVISRDSVQSLQDLHGKTFAVARTGSFDDTLAKQYLRARGVEPDSVQFVGLGDPNIRVQALAAGQIDATLTSVSTWVSIRKQPGIKILAPFEDVNAAVPSWPSGLTISGQVARDKPEQLRRFMRVFVKASRYFATNKQAWVDAMSKQRTDMSANDLGELWDLYQHDWAVNGGLNLREYDSGASLLYATSPDFASVPHIELQRWVDPQFADAAINDLGTDPSADEPDRAK